jgi:hypothetical protein
MTSLPSRPARSLPSFDVGQSLNPYPAHYRLAFAFSGLLYPLHLSLSLRSGYHPSVECIGLTQLMVKRETHRVGWNLSPGGDTGVADGSALRHSAPRTFWLQRLTFRIVSLLRCLLLTRCTILHFRSPFRRFPRPLPP